MVRRPLTSSLPLQAGQERFRTLSTSFYRGAHGVILVYDISSRASFLTLDKWFEEAKAANTVEGVLLYLVRVNCPCPTEYLRNAHPTEADLASLSSLGCSLCSID